MPTEASPVTPPPKPPRGKLVLLVVGVILAGGLVVAGIGYLKVARAQREVSRSMLCTSNLKLIGMAIQNYHDAYRSFPPAYVADADGRPMHSWRLLILPYLGDPDAAAVYEAYRFDEPWDSEHNRQLAARMPSVFRCPHDPDESTSTRYLAVVGEETMWPGATGATFRGVRDGIANTICLVEAGDAEVPWLEPRDLSINEALDQVAAPRHPQGAKVLTGDARILALIPDADLQTVRAMLTADGQEVFDEMDVRAY